jgi:hypothetical protein
VGLSILRFNYTGDTDFDLNFAGGYASKSDVSAYIDRATDSALQFDWLTDSQVRIIPDTLAIGEQITFIRTVSKTTLPVDFSVAGTVTRENVTTATMHALYVAHEMLDGRISDYDDLNGVIFETVDKAVQSALSNFLFQATFKQDIVVKGALTSSSAKTYTSGGFYCDAADVAVYIESTPSEEVELLITNGGQVQYSCTVSPTGVVTPTSISQVDLAAGPITVSEAGGNYATGLQYAVVLPVVNLAYVDFDIAISDYINIFEEART